MEKDCHLFLYGENEFYNKKNFSVIKDYGEIPTPNDGKRYLLKCNECGALFLYQTFEWNTDKGDFDYNDYIQISSEDEADELNNSLKWFNFRDSRKNMIVTSKKEVHFFKANKEIQ